MTQPMTERKIYITTCPIASCGWFFQEYDKPALGQAEERKHWEEYHVSQR